MLIDRGWPVTEIAYRLADSVPTVQRVYLHKLKDSDRDIPDSMGNGWATQDPETTPNGALEERPAGS